MGSVVAVGVRAIPGAAAVGGRGWAEHGRYGAGVLAVVLPGVLGGPLWWSRASGVDQVARAQVRSRRVKPQPTRLRRFSAAVRHVSQAFVLGGAAVVQLDPPPAVGGDLGDGAFDVGPVDPVVLAKSGVSRSVRAQQVVAFVQDHRASGLG